VFAMLPGQTSSQIIPWAVPSNAPIKSTYRISYLLDSNNSVVESSAGENNNFSPWSDYFTVSASSPSNCPATTINHCTLAARSPGQTSGTCEAGYVSTCQYTCDSLGSGNWQINSNSCTGPAVTLLEICLWNGSSATNCGESVSVAPGTPLAIRWNSSNADTCNRTAGPADFTTGGAVSGIDTTVTAPATANTTSTYTISCTRGGVAASAATDSVTATTAVDPELTVSKATVRKGDNITVSWDTNNGNEALCTLSGGTLTTATLSNGTGDAETGNASQTISGRTTFTLTCNGLSDVKTVEIIPENWES
jgi:hypothetical protein